MDESLKVVSMKDPFELMSYSHFISVALCIAFVVFFPRLFVGSSQATLRQLKLTIVVLILSFQVLDFFKVVYLFGEPWKTALPLQLCDFSALSIAGYLISGNKHLFNFAFFWGISGAGMAILTPNAVYAFPAVDYLANQYGHSLILLGISVAMIVFNERPYAKDIFIIFGATSAMLLPIYLINYLLEAPTNYWYLLEKPYGSNIISPLPEAPYHMLALYPIAFLFLLAIYAPYYVKDNIRTARRLHI